MKYELIHLSESETPIVVSTFDANNLDDASNYVESYNSTHPDSKCLFRECKKNHYILRSDGTKVEYDLEKHSQSYYILWDYITDSISPFKNELRRLMHVSNHSFFETVHMASLVRTIAMYRSFYSHETVRKSILFWYDASYKLEWYCWDKWKDLIYNYIRYRKNVDYFKKYGHSLHEPWSLDRHVLNDIKWNLKRLINESVGIPDVFFKKVETEQPELCYNDKEKQALSLLKTTYEHIIHLIDLYDFYTFEIDETDESYSDDMSVIYVKNSYQIIDFKRMHDKSIEIWNEIMDEFKTYGRYMFD